MQQYIESSAARGLDQVEVVQFLFKLRWEARRKPPCVHHHRSPATRCCHRPPSTCSFCDVGEAYPVAALTDTQRQLLADMAAFGMLWQRSASADRYVPDVHPHPTPRPPLPPELCAHSTHSLCVMHSMHRTRFYPTSLATTLTVTKKATAPSSAVANRSAVALKTPGADATAAAGQGVTGGMKIIVEKNFKVCTCGGSAQSECRGCGRAGDSLLVPPRCACVCRCTCTRRRSWRRRWSASSFTCR